MELRIGGVLVAPAGVLEDRMVRAGAPLRLQLILAADEELVAASLSLRGRTLAAAEPSFSAPTLSSDAETPGSFTAVTWVSADWGSGRSLAKLSLCVLDPGAATLAQIKIARGGSGWYSPPGPLGVSLPAGVPVSLSFPDTVADRLMVELLELGVPRPCTLSTVVIDGESLGELPLGFAPAARSPQLRLSGRSSFFRHEGVIATGTELEVPALFSTLRDQLPALRGQEFSLELDAAAAGQLGLRWALTVDRHPEEFAGYGAQVELSLPWAEVGEVVLWPGLSGDALAEIQGLRLQVDWSPSSERVELAPVPDPPRVSIPSLGPDADRRGLAGLLRPRYQQAQGFTKAPTRPLQGVDLWVRCLRPEQGLELSLEIVEDSGGSPIGASLGKLALSLGADDPALQRKPGWLALDLPAPLSISAARWWLVVRVDQGELAWHCAAPEQGEASRRDDIAGARYRIDGGPWLSRDDAMARGWALTRLRGFEAQPAPAPMLELIADDLVYALSPSAEDPSRFELPTFSPKPRAASLRLRARSEVAGQLRLSALDLRWRAVSPIPESPDAEVADLALEPTQAVP